MNGFDKRLLRCCFTGHRPEKLFICKAAVKEALQHEISAAITEGITTFISGMARGVDLWAAQLVLYAKQNSPNIKLICAIPYDGFEKNWSNTWRQLYCEVLACSDYRKIFYPSFQYDSFQTRNRWMVDHSQRVIAVYHGGRGGTYNTLNYAKTQKVKICIIPG